MVWGLDKGFCCVFEGVLAKKNQRGRSAVIVEAKAAGFGLVGSYDSHLP